MTVLQEDRLVEVAGPAANWPANPVAGHHWRTLLTFGLLGAWFFLVFPTEPLYFENQNTKFLHGLARAGVGHLDRDWTASTEDVMPVFTGIVYLLHVGLPAWSSYAL